MTRIGLITVAIVILATGCGSGDDVTAPGRQERASLIVSDAAPAPDDSATYAYASLPFGAVPRGARATVRNRASGVEARASIIDGAVDPVKLPGATGDTVDLTAEDSSGAVFEFFNPIQLRALPRVVRSSPGMRATDSPSLLRVEVVFSEPIAENTINRTTVFLLLRGQPVPGQVLLSETGLVAEFVPADSLVPGATYTLVVTREVRDRSGDALAEEYRAEFTVAAAVGSTIEFATVSAGNGYTCAVSLDGAVYCWGRGDKGQLGDGTLRNRHWPALAVLPSPALDVQAGEQTTCAGTDASRVLCWGSPYSYLADFPNRPDSLYPLPAAVLGDRELSRPAVGGGRMCGVTRENVLWCTGSRPALPNGAILIDPDPGPWLGVERLAWVGLGQYHDCYVDLAGEAYCKGSNLYGELGIGTTGGGVQMEGNQVPVAGGFTFSSVTTGHYHTCGLAASKAYCWGVNPNGQLGVGDDGPYQSPAPHPVSGDLEWVALDAGKLYTCGLAAGGVAYCWGENGLGQLGDGSRTRRDAPVAVGGALRFRSISAGWNHACAVTVDAAIYCWGENDSGQLGDGSTSDALSPVRIADRR